MRIHIKTVSFGLVLLFIGIGGGLMVSERSSWHPGTATVQRVTKQCEMTATERQIVTKTTFSATIDCDDVDLFKLLHSDKSWHSSPVYTGDLRIERDGQVTRAELALHASKTHEPTRGDTFAVLQDPNDASKVALRDDYSNNPLFAGAFGVAGSLLCWLGFGLPGLRRRTQTIAVPEAMMAPQPQLQPAVADAYDRHPAPRTTYVPPPRQPAITSGRPTFGKRRPT